MSKSIRTLNFNYSSFIPEWNIERSNTGLTVFNDIKLDFDKDDDYITFNYEYPIYVSYSVNYFYHRLLH